jgi:hypothetical protein
MIPQMIYQPHAFEATQHGYFYQKARERKTVASRPLKPAIIFIIHFDKGPRGSFFSSFFIV